MKVNKKCMDCEREFKANKNNNYILCIICRKKHSNVNNHKNLIHKYIKIFNEKHKCLKINSTSGYYNLSINLNNLSLKGSLSGILDKKAHKDYLIDSIELLEKELKKLEI